MIDKQIIYVQWHLTNRCNKKCRHCYMSSGNTKIKELELEDLKIIFDKLMLFKNRTGIELRFTLTGGDPFLHNSYEQVFEFFCRQDIRFNILCNPESITEENMTLAQKFNVKDIQLSIDGMQNYHDWMRGSGSFERLVNAISVLKKYDINIKLMYTVFRNNMNDLTYAMEFAHRQKVSSFTFDFGVPTGNSDIYEMEVLTSDEVKNLFKEYINKRDQLKKMGTNTLFSDKSSLMMAYYQDQNSMNPNHHKGNCHFGCMIGRNNISINENGEMVLCSRLPVAVGDVLEEDIYDLWYHNEKLEEFRNRKKWKECGECNLFNYCKGCPAVSYAMTGDMFSKCNYCWKSDRTDNNVGEANSMLVGNVREEIVKIKWIELNIFKYKKELLLNNPVEYCRIEEVNPAELDYLFNATIGQRKCGR